MKLIHKTMECKGYSGLYFIEEVVDVTGHLGVIIFNGLGLAVMLRVRMYRLNNSALSCI